MSAKCSHRWKFRVSQDGLLYVRFCPKCTICEYLDQDRAWSTMSYTETPTEKCPSTYRKGAYACEKDAAHLNRRGDVEHQRGDVKWLSV